LSIRYLTHISILELIVVSLVLYTIPDAHAKAETSLTITLENFTLTTGASKGLTATLTSDGNPVVGENIIWNVTVGAIGPRIYPTDNAGQVWVVYTAPSYENTVYENTVYVTASYAGSEQYMPSSAVSHGTITALTPINPVEPSSPSTGFSWNNIVIIAIAIICIIVVPAILSGKL
jgi:hypothetical protein